MIIPDDKQQAKRSYDKIKLMKKLVIILLLFTTTVSASIFINSFNSGQLSKDLKQRHDLDKTSMGSEELTNILIRPQGIAYKRPGTEFIDTELGETGTPEVLGDYPTLRATTDQADPGLTHTTSISSFQDMVDNFLPDLPLITAMADSGVYVVFTTATNHGLVTKDSCVIINTTNYNSTYNSSVTYVSDTQFKLPIATFKGNDAKGMVYKYPVTAISGNYYLTGNVDAAESATAGFLDGSGWQCLNGTSFTGTLDGCGYSITDLTQLTTNRGSNTRESGLFFSMSGKLANLTIADENKIAIANGGIFGGSITSGGTVYNCHASGIVKAFNVGTTAMNSFGGFCGYVGNATIYDSTTSATVDIVSYHTKTGTISYVGGFAGQTASTGSAFLNCSATGNVVASGSTATVDDAGGFVGYTISNTYSDCSATGDVEGDSDVGGFVGAKYSGTGTFARCSATGDVTAVSATLGVAGGFAGRDIFASGDGSYTDCYAWGNVVAGSSSIGGGFSGTGGDLIRCYSIGTVSGGTTGGLMGTALAGSSANVSYWDTETSAQPTSAKGTGQTTTEMKTESTYVGWDFDTIWYMAYTPASSKDVSGKVRLIPFEYSVSDAYVLEFGHEYIGFLRTTP